MRIAVSNIAWDDARDDTVLGALAGCGVEGIEVAPTKYWPEVRQATAADAEAERSRLRRHGLIASSMQSLLFGRPDLVLFGSAEARDAMALQLEHVMELAASLGAGPLVFGCPKQRDPGALDPALRDEIAIAAFRRFGDVAVRTGTTLVVEANPAEYGCRWLTSLTEADAFVQAVGHPGVGLHVDLGGMALAGEDANVIRGLRSEIRHVHVSRPYLRAVAGTSDPGEPTCDHKRIAQALAEVGYSGWISIEMGAPAGGLSELVDAVAATSAWYG